MTARILAILLALATGAWAVSLRDNLRTSNITVPGAAATVVTDSCAVNGCTATATCAAGIVVWAKGRNNSSTCDGGFTNTQPGIRHKLDCMGNTSCAQVDDDAVATAACVVIACMGN